MTRHTSFVLAGTLAALAASAAAQAPVHRQDTVVAFETDKGTIELELDSVRAPATAANFLRYVDGGFFDGGSVNRAVRPDNTVRHDVEIQVIQFQIDEARSRQAFPPIPLERTSVTGVTHVDGTISMARGGPDTATGSFSIVIGDQPEMDFGGRRNPDGQGFAAFGHVVRGMDVVKAIHASPTGKAGPYGTESLAPPIRILKAVPTNASRRTCRSGSDVRRGDRERPRRGRHRRAVVHRGRRHHRRQHRRHWQPVADRAATRRSTPRDRWSRPASSTCSASPSTTCSSTSARPRRSRRASRPRSRARAPRSLPSTTRCWPSARPRLRRYGFTPDFRTLDGYFKTLAKRGTAVNLATFVGAGGAPRLRHRQGRPPRDGRRELARKCEALVAGHARGRARRLLLAPVRARHVQLDRRARSRMAKVAAKYGGAYFTHQRSEANAIDRRSTRSSRSRRAPDIRTQIWHLKTAYKRNWGKMPAVLASHRGRARAGHRRDGQPVPLDDRARTASTRACRPGSARAGGGAAQAPRRSGSSGAGQGRDMEDTERRGATSTSERAARTASARLRPHHALRRSTRARRFRAIAAEEKKDPRDALIDLVIADRAESSVIIFMMDESDVIEAMRTPSVSFYTDSGARAEDGRFSEEKSHPRAGAPSRASSASTCGRTACSRWKKPSAR